MVKTYSDEEFKEIGNSVHKWYIEFSESKSFEELTEEQKKESEFIVMSFTEYMYSYHRLSPEEWDEDGLEKCCLYTLPRKITTYDSYYRSITPVLSSFFAFVGEKNLLKNTSQLIKKVKEIDKQILKNARDPKDWGMAKSFAMAAIDAGVDITNKEEMQKFITYYNLQQLAKSERHESKPVFNPKSKKPKIGRNASCTCGSGKKYKKCCSR